MCLADKLTSDGSTTPAGLVAASLAHGFALFVAVSVGANISGGHVNPAVTFGAFMGGNISLLRGILYWIAQLLGSTVACLLLKFSTGGLVRREDFIFKYVLLWALRTGSRHPSYGELTRPGRHWVEEWNEFDREQRRLTRVT